MSSDRALAFRLLVRITVSKRESRISDLPDSKSLTLTFLEMCQALFRQQLEIKEAAKLWEQSSGHVMV